MRAWVLVFAFALGLAGCSDDVAGLDDDTLLDGAAPPVWSVETGVPTEADLLGIWGRAADDVYAVGWDGTIVHWDGTAWSLETTSSTVVLTAVHGIPAPPPMDPPDPNPPPPGPIFASGWGGTILERIDGNWQTVAPTSTHTEDLFDLFIGGEDSGLAVGDGGRVLEWDGTTWSKITMFVPGEFSGSLIEPKSTLQAVWSGNGRRYYIAGSGGVAYRSTGGTQNFEALDTRVFEPLRDLWGPATNDVFAVGLGTLILRYGGQWRRIRNDGADELPNTFLFGVSGTAGDDVTVVGWKGIVARYDGTAWFVEETGVESDLRGVWVDPVTEVAYAVGARGLIIRRDPPPPDPEMMMME